MSLDYRKVTRNLLTVLLLGLMLLVVGLARAGHLGETVVEAAAMNEVSRAMLLKPSSTLSHTVLLPFVARGYTAAKPAPSIFGVQMYGSITEGRQALSQARSAQVHWIRLPISWNAVEPSNVAPGQYNWSTVDADVRNAAASGHRLILTISSAPPWAATYRQGPVHAAALPDFAQFVRELAERYDGDGYRDALGSPIVDHFELFNEPDSTNRDAAEQGYGSYYGRFGADYAAMLCSVHPAVKAGNASARVVLGGIAYDSLTYEGGSFYPDFLEDVLKAGGGACFDVMNFHYYPAFAGKWYPHGNGVIGKAAFIRSLLSRYGHGAKPMIVTEAGWHSDHYDDKWPGSPEIQSRYVVQLFTQGAAARLESMIWWNWIDIGFPYGENGLLTKDLRPKPSIVAYRAAAERIGQAQFDRIVGTPVDTEGYRFIDKAGLPIYVLWTNDGQSHAVKLHAASARVVNMYGDTLAWLNDATDGQVDGQVTVVFGPNPIYVEAQP